MTGFQHIEDNFHADGVKLTDIARDNQTPCYVYAHSLIKENFLRLKNTFDAEMPDQAPLIAYACKANSTLAILSSLAELGSGADIVSGGEMIRAIEAGIQPEKIVFSGVGKTYEEIASAIDNNIAQINIESPAEMDLISRIAADKKVKMRISFRLNPDVDAKTHSKITTGKRDSKFGIAPDVIRELYKKAADDPCLDPLGVSVHIGSQLTTIEPFREAFTLLADFVRTLQEDDGHEIQTLDLGGGIGIIYDDETLFDLTEYVHLIREIIAPLGTRIILEPGRTLLGNAGLLLSRVLYFKQSGDKNFLVVDAGMTDFMRPSLYDAIHPVVPVIQDKGATKTYDIVGPVCESSDVLAKNVVLPVELETPGSLVAFMMAGAYGSVMASLYNARALPAEIMVKDGLAREIRTRVNVRDILARENIPDWSG